jgi:hypothetical protein
MFEGFLHYKAEMGALGTITIEILAFIFMSFEGIGKHGFCFFDLHADFRQVGQFERSTILVDKSFNVEAVVLQITVLYVEAFLGKIECLLDEVVVGIVH